MHPIDNINCSCKAKANPHQLALHQARETATGTHLQRQLYDRIAQLFLLRPLSSNDGIYAQHDEQESEDEGGPPEDRPQPELDIPHGIET